MNTVVHVLNLTPCVPLEFDVPDRIWSDNEISYDHLHVFGCKAFMHVPKDERSKLDAKIRPCVFIGYGQDELGYRFSMIQCKKACKKPRCYVYGRSYHTGH